VIAAARLAVDWQLPIPSSKRQVQKNWSLTAEMDVLYYWKDHVADLRMGRIGFFRSAKDKLEQLSGGYPDEIWVVKTPRGRKGEVQLLGRLKWSDTLTVSATLDPQMSHIFYRHDDPCSIWFDEGTAAQHIPKTTAWMRTYFPASVRANFQGSNGQQALLRPALLELRRLTATWPATPFRSAHEDIKNKTPI
jgi:hypothetical protein